MDGVSSSQFVKGPTVTAPTAASPPSRTGWLDGLSGLGGRVAQAFSSSTPKPEQQYARIRTAAENLRTMKPGQTTAMAAGMTLDDAKKLRELADRTNDKELMREADFIQRMLTDYRPSNTSAAPAEEPLPRGHVRYGSDARCPGSVARANPGLRGNDLVRAVWEGCGG